jgi:predicted ATP-grasp superfamily ATP-dependent carboligase
MADDLAQGSVPVLAFGCELTLIGVTRILGRDKIPLYVVCDGSDFVRSSRWYSEPPVKAENLKPDELELFLRSLPLQRAILMPCTDDWLRAVSSLPDALARQFPASIASPVVIQTMVDKWQFAQLLEQTGTPHPETLFVSSGDHLESLPEKCFTRKILKPLSSIDFARKHRVKGYLVTNRAEAMRLSTNIDFPVLLQDFIPGPPSANVFVEGFVDRNGRTCARFARQRLRMYPPNLGNSTLSKTVRLTEITEAVNSLDHLLSSVSYRGIFSAEFKYDARDSHFKILEINARPWWYVEFAARCGMDLCRLAYLDALNLPVIPIRDYQVGRRCVLLSNDFRAYLGARRGEALSSRSWVRSWSGADGALLAWDDLWPAITCAVSYVESALKKRISKHAL